MNERAVCYDRVMPMVTIELDPVVADALRGRAAAAQLSVEALLVALAEEHVRPSRVSPDVKAMIQSQIEQYRPAFDRLAE